MAPEGKRNKALSDREKRRVQWWKDKKKKAQGKEKSKIVDTGDDVPIQLLSKGKAEPVKNAQGFKTLLKPAVLNIFSGSSTPAKNTPQNPPASSETLNKVDSVKHDDLMDQVTSNLEDFALKSSKKKKGKKQVTFSESPKDSTAKGAHQMDESEDSIVSGTSKLTSGGLLANKTDKKGKTGKSWKDFLVLFMGNLPYDVTDDDIRQHFIRAGGIKDVRLLTDKKTGKPRGCGYIEFLDQKNYQFGLRLHKSTLKGRTINVEATVPGQKVFRSKILQKMKDRNMKGKKKQKTGGKKSMGGGPKGLHKIGQKGKKAKTNKYKRR